MGLNGKIQGTSPYAFPVIYFTGTSLNISVFLYTSSLSGRREKYSSNIKL
jgi:hypothetical protein